VNAFGRNRSSPELRVDQKDEKWIFTETRQFGSSVQLGEKNKKEAQ